jgi:hypothetical protein
LKTKDLKRIIVKKNSLLLVTGEAVGLLKENKSSSSKLGKVDVGLAKGEVGFVAVVAVVEGFVSVVAVTVVGLGFVVKENKSSSSKLGKVDVGLAKGEVGFIAVVVAVVVVGLGFVVKENKSSSSKLGKVDVGLAKGEVGFVSVVVVVVVGFVSVVVVVVVGFVAVVVVVGVVVGLGFVVKENKSSSSKLGKFDVVGFAKGAVGFLIVKKLKISSLSSKISVVFVLVGVEAVVVFVVVGVEITGVVVAVVVVVATVAVIGLEGKLVVANGVVSGFLTTGVVA